MKRFLSFLFILVLALSFAACGTTEQTPSDSVSSTESTSSDTQSSDTDKEPEAVVYDPDLEHKFIVTDQETKSIVVYDLNKCNGDFTQLTDDSLCIVWEWKWAEDPNSKFVTHTGLDSAKYRYSPVYEKDVVVACSSSGWVGIIDYEARALLWEDDLGGSPHSVEMLPNGDVVVADASADLSGKNGRFVYYALSAGVFDAPVHQIPGTSPHGVSWDPEENCVWGLDVLGVICINVSGMGTETAKLVQISGMDATFKDGKTGGHALAPVGGEPGKYWVSNNADLQVFDSETGTITNSYASKKILTMAEIKGICSFADGTVIQAVVHIGGECDKYYSNGLRLIVKELSSGKVTKAVDREIIVPFQHRGFYKVQPFTKDYQ